MSAHHAVNSLVTNFRAVLYRDFPNPGECAAKNASDVIDHRLQFRPGGSAGALSVQLPSRR